MNFFFRNNGFIACVAGARRERGKLAGARETRGARERGIKKEVALPFPFSLAPRVSCAPNFLLSLPLSTPVTQADGSTVSPYGVGVEKR